MLFPQWLYQFCYLFARSVMFDLIHCFPVMFSFVFPPPQMIVVIRVVQFGRRLVVLRRLAHHKGEDGSSIRWFAEYDASVQALRHRHSRMLLADLVVIMQGASPFNAEVDFADDLSEVFRKSGQSMQAACHVLRDESLFQVISIFQSSFHPFKRFQPPAAPIHPHLQPSPPHPERPLTPRPKHTWTGTPPPTAPHLPNPNYVPRRGPADPQRSVRPLPAGSRPPHPAGPERQGRDRGQHCDQAWMGDLRVDASPQ
jgi:hypothetical protein